MRKVAHKWHLYKIGPLCDRSMEFRCRVSYFSGHIAAKKLFFFLKKGKQIRLSIALTNDQIWYQSHFVRCFRSFEFTRNSTCRAMNAEHRSHGTLQKRPFGTPQKIITVIAMCKGFTVEINNYRHWNEMWKRMWRRDIIVEKKISILMNKPSKGRSCHAYLATKSSRSCTWNNNNNNNNIIGDKLLLNFGAKFQR